jgi:methylglyoxal synthase
MSDDQQHRLKMGTRKNIALIAHDNRKKELLEWVEYNIGTLSKHNLFGTGTTGGLITSKLGLEVHRYRSGPLGGDQQIGAGISEGTIDFMIFFWDPLQSQPHDVDVKALLRLSVLYNIPVACNRATADFLVSSPLLNGNYERIVYDFQLPNPNLSH